MHTSMLVSKGTTQGWMYRLFPEFIFFCFVLFFCCPLYTFSFVSHFHLCEVLWHIFFAPLLYVSPPPVSAYWFRSGTVSTPRPVISVSDFFSFSAVMRPPFFLDLSATTRRVRSSKTHTQKKMNWLKKLKKRQMNKSEAAAMTPFYYACGCAKLF